MGCLITTCIRCCTYWHDKYIDWHWDDMEAEYMQSSSSNIKRDMHLRSVPPKSIHVAVIDKSPDDIRRIIAENEEAKTKLNSASETAMHLACRLGYTEIVEVLLECDCPVDMQTDIGTPIHCVLQAVLKKYISNDGGVDLVLKLINAGCNVNKVDRGGKTALLLAVENGNHAGAEILIDAGAEVSITESNGFSPLYIAVIAGNLQCVKTLLRAPLVDTNIKDGAGRTALLAALITIATNFRNDFYNNGRWRNNQTPVPATNRCKMTSVVEELLRAGTNLNAMDNHGRNALVLAFQILELDLLNCSRNCGCFNRTQALETSEEASSCFKDEKESQYAALTRLLILYGARFPLAWSGAGKDYTRNPRWMRELYEEATRLSQSDAEYLMEKPNRLAHVTRMTIRSHLAIAESLHLISELSLPSKLKDYVAVRAISDR